MSGMISSIPVGEPAAFTLTKASRSAGAMLAGHGGGNFASQLAAAGNRKAGELESVGNQLVATAFVLPILEALRSDPFKSDLFHGGRGEEVFGQQLDVIFAERITSSANFGIGDAVTRKFAGTPAPDPGISLTPDTSNNPDDTRFDTRG